MNCSSLKETRKHMTFEYAKLDYVQIKKTAPKGIIETMEEIRNIEHNTG